ncbi:hypothetical protein PIB30_017434 [Stylosanthes scabra]|uniref:Uncharacterized protein n=1 Tax=Stylosanthes scabra TaxID=79078 RepID=A0ABU6X7B5_9FABA|nr:hypothetical protein [Stylosanthes scabra]
MAEILTDSQTSTGKCTRSSGVLGLSGSHAGFTPQCGEGAAAFQRHFSRVFSGLKPIVNHRLLCTDAKPQILTFKRDWNCIVWSSVTRVILTLVQRGPKTINDAHASPSSVMKECGKGGSARMHHHGGAIAMQRANENLHYRVQPFVTRLQILLAVVLSLETTK